MFMRGDFRKKFYAAEKFLSRLTDKQFMLLSFLLVIFLSLFVLRHGHNWGGDFSQYIAQSRAILNGEISAWLEKQSFIISSSTPGFSPLIYPWMTAIILVPLYAIFGLNLYVFKLAEVFLLAAAWIIFFRFLRLKENFIAAAILTAIPILNLHYIFLTDNVLSECPFLFFSFLSIYLFYKRRFSALLGAAIFFAVNTRTLGIALLIALLLDDIFWLRKFPLTLKKIFPRAVPYITYIILSIIFSQLLPQIPIQNNSGYLVTFSLNLSDIAGQIIYYTKLFGSFFLPNSDGIPIFLAAIFWITLAVIGAAKTFSENRFLIFYVAITLAIVVAFNTQAGIRYIFGIIPVVLYFAYLGIKNFRRKKFIAVGVLALSLFFSVTSIANFIFGGKSNQAYTHEAVAAYDFINKNIPDDKIIYFFKPRVLYLNTNCYTYFRWEDAEDSLSLADYVLLTDDDWYPKLRKIAENNPQRYQKLFDNEKFYLYRIRREGKIF